MSAIGKEWNYPYNKCDKYLRTLIDNGVIIKRDKDYDFKNPYFRRWYELFYLRQSEMDITKNKNRIEEELPKFFESMCLDHAENQKWGFDSLRFSEDTVTVENKIVLNGFFFDQIISANNRKHFVIIVKPGESFLQKDLLLMEAAISKVQPLYDSKVFIYKIDCFPGSCVSIAASVDYLHLITAKQLRE